ncbi:MAG: outer membrane protein assembly factor BamE [Deltaproteobacteria bacterium]|nr:outer membrane protein assembly factor BamE [Deltaproteobacteria bacterium]
MKNSFRRWRILSVLLALALITASCGENKISKANFDKIKTGMTEAEVQAILGPPTESSGVDVAVFAGTTSVWKKGDTVISVQFVNGKVIAKQFSKTPPTAK